MHSESYAYSSFQFVLRKSLMKRKMLTGVIKLLVHKKIG